MAQVLVEGMLLKAGTPAGSDHNSYDPNDVNAFGQGIGFGLTTFGSIQITWAGLTGTVDSVATVVVSNDGVGWVVKKMPDNVTPVAITLSGTDGTDMISLNGVISEKFYGIQYAHNSVTGGTIKVQADGKEI